MISKTPKTIVALNYTGTKKLFIIPILFLVNIIIGCSSGNEGHYAERKVKFFGFEYEIKNNSLNIFGNKIENVYQVGYSENGENIVFTQVLHGSQPNVFLVSKNMTTPERLTNTNYIEFDLAVNNSGDVAFARHINSVSESQVIVNNVALDLPTGLYKNLTLRGSKLAMNYIRHYDETNWLFIYDIKSKEINKSVVNLTINHISFDSDYSLLIEGLNMKTFKNEVVLYDLEGKKTSYVHESDPNNSCFLDYELISQNNLICFREDQTKEKLLFLGLRRLFLNDPTLALACSNNDLGRVSWSVSYRLNALLTLHSINPNSTYPTVDIIKNAVNCILSNSSKKNLLPGWPTKKYSLSGNTPLSLMIDNSMILYPLLSSINYGLANETEINKVLQLAEDLYDFYEPNYDTVTGNYHFKKGIDFWPDGLWLPFNMQNMFGLSLIELYKKTENNIYKTRAIELGKSFHDNFIHTDNGAVYWSYWPSFFYLGWDVYDNYSFNTPKRNPSVDKLYEDIGHAGLSVKFIFEMNRSFGFRVFSNADIESLSTTLDGFQIGQKYSRFISGDTSYQPASRWFLPKYGWPEIYNKSLQDHISEGIPNSAPLFEGDHTVTYLQSYLSENKEL